MPGDVRCAETLRGVMPNAAPPPFTVDGRGGVTARREDAFGGGAGEASGGGTLAAVDSPPWRDTNGGVD